MADQTGNVQQQVEQAFQAARQGDFGRIGGLPRLGPEVAPLLAPYLHDRQLEIRREAVAVLGVLGGAQALPLLLEALRDPDADLRERAARALYSQYEPTALARDKAAGVALRASAAAGNRSAACLLLLGYFPGVETEQSLHIVLKDVGAEHTKLTDSGPLVSVALPTQMALSRLGDRSARAALLRTIDQASSAEAEFFLAVLRDIDSPTVLHAIKALLGDNREIAGGVPSGAEPRRRLRDAAVDAFVKRLSLHIDFELSASRRYSDAQIAEVRQRIDSQLPQ
ncbi:MAG: HEAT repeat domain-containing protein [Gammaproteobacteria bacterium]